MNIIKVLDDQVINKIAAGEVVEKPVAVVKELVDNAIDAEASRIQVYIEDGGLKLVEVRDNGFGMTKLDATTAFERHATSKLEDSQDLDYITTMGFRGEALSSIAAVSQVNLKTKRIDLELGTSVSYYGGKLKDVTAVACANGTVISVKNLFFNVPARKKFLKSAATEQAKITQWMKQISLAQPNIQFELYSDDKQIFKLLPVTKPYLRAEQVFGHAFQFMHKTEGEYELQAFISHPGEAQQRKTSFYLLVNGRVIQDSLLIRAVKEGYGTSLKDREYPQGYIHLKCNPRDIDINVHPQKAEVRFRNTQFVFNFVKSVVQEILAGNKQSIYDRDQSLNFENKNLDTSVAQASKLNYPSASYQNDRQQTTYAPISLSLKTSPESLLNNNFIQNTNSISKESSNINDKQVAFEYTKLAYIGRLLACYLLFEYEQKFYIIDMHAAHERCNFNRIRMSLVNRNIIQQKLLVPEVVNLTESEVINCLENAKSFANIGFEIDEFSSKAIIVRSVPSQLPNINVQAFIQEAAQAELNELISGQFYRELDHIAARLACHASIRSGDYINETEVKYLLKQLEEAESSAACPHGRPVIASFAERDVSKWFGRDK